MAVSPTPTPIFWRPVRVDIDNHNTLRIHRPLIAGKKLFRRPSTFICSSSLKSSKSEEEKRELLKQYGLNPDDFLSDPTPSQSRRNKEQQKTGRGQQVGPPHEQTKPRETHRLLQVLGGKARRKKLLSPKSMDVRPMMEVVKGAAFGILQAAGGCPTSLRPGRWLDLYSGTGSVGIEAISRGCSEVHFVEMDPWVVSDVLRPNLEWTGFLDDSVIHTVRVETYLERAKGPPFDYISITPPYMLVDYEILMKQISESSVIGDDSFIVVEYPFRTDMLETCGCLVKVLIGPFSEVHTSQQNQPMPSQTDSNVEKLKLRESGVEISGVRMQPYLMTEPQLADRRFGRTHLAIYGPKWAQKKGRS